jgi:Family of unknown function (DUF5989)
MTARKRKGSLLGDLLGFLLHNKKWWLVPLILALIVAGALVWLGGSAAAPFIYPLY